MVNGEWSKVKWGDIATLEYGKSLKDYRDSGGPIPVYGTNGLIGYTDRPLCPFPSVIVGRKGAYRGIHYSKTPFYVIDTAFYLKPKGVVLDLKYAYYQLLTLNINDMDSGSAIPSTSRPDFYNLDLHLPDICFQQKIASILTSLDDKIELNLQMNKTLEAIAQAIFKEWFVDFRFPGFDGKLVDGLPKGWSMRKLTQVAQVEIGRTPPRMENQWFSTNNKDVKWISIRDMGSSGIFVFNTSEYLTLSAIEKFRIPVIPPNTVVLSFKLTIGRVGITTERMVSNEAIAQIKSDTLNSGFIYCLLRNYHFDSLGSTSSIASAINSKIIKEMEVLVPEQKVVDEFCRLAGPVFNKIKNNSLEIKTITEIRDSLLPRLMTGKIRVA